MCLNSEGPGETAQMHMLVWALAGRLCDKYHNLMSWLILFLKKLELQQKSLNDNSLLGHKQSGTV